MFTEIKAAIEQELEDATFDDCTCELCDHARATLNLISAQSDYIEAMQSGTEVAGKWEAVDRAAKAFLEAVK